MPRRPRLDYPGCLHHVMSRGLARRTIFESRADARFFLALLACCHRRGLIEVHAYAILATHFHLLLRSVNGDLSNAMRWILNQHVRRFNRLRRRDGPLMRGRFKSIPVHSKTYLRTLIRYIDQNPVDAGLAPTPSAFAYGSAGHHRRAGPHPRWLSRTLVDRQLRPWLRADPLSRAAAYDATFAPCLSAGQRRWVEARLAGHAEPFDPIDDLLSSSRKVLAWAREKAKLADGTRPGLPMLDVDTALDVLRDPAHLSMLTSAPDTPLAAGRHCAAELMAVALLRDAAGRSFREISTKLELGESTPKRRYARHRNRLEDTTYAANYADLTHRALLRAHHVSS